MTFDKYQLRKYYSYYIVQYLYKILRLSLQGYRVFFKAIPLPLIAIRLMFQWHESSNFYKYFPKKEMVKLIGATILALMGLIVQIQSRALTQPRKTSDLTPMTPSAQNLQTHRTLYKAPIWQLKSSPLFSGDISHTPFPVSKPVTSLPVAKSTTRQAIAGPLRLVPPKKQIRLRQEQKNGGWDSDIPVFKQEYMRKGLLNNINGNFNAVLGSGNYLRGNQNALQGYGNNLIGLRNQLQGQQNTIFGDYNNIKGDFNNVIGHQNKALGYENTVFGNRNNLIGLKNNVIGSHNLVKKGQNTVLGNINFIDGYQNKIFGSGNTALGDQNILEGDMNQAYGDSNGVFGGGNFVWGSGNIIDGDQNNVKGVGNIVMGKDKGVRNIVEEESYHQSGYY